MIRAVISAGWLLAYAVGVTLVLPARSGAQTMVAPIVRLYPNYSISAATEYVFFGPSPPTGLAAGLAVAAGTPLDCAHGGVVVAQDTVWIASAGVSASYVLLAQ